MSPREAIRVFDGVLPDFDAYRAWTLHLPYAEVPIGPLRFGGLAPVPSSRVSDVIRACCPDLSPATLTFCRCSPAGQREPHYIHTDRDMGTWTAILYLTAVPAPGDGTTFWARCADDAWESQTASLLEACEWQDPARWKSWYSVDGRPNRLVVFPAGYYHSRSLFENYGETPETSRLIQVAFGGDRVCRH